LFCDGIAAQNQSKNYTSGAVYLTTTAPQVFDSTNSSIANNYSKNVSHQKAPTINKVVSTTASKPSSDSNSNKEMTSSNISRPMVYLERPTANSMVVPEKSISDFFRSFCSMNAFLYCIEVS